MKKTEEKVGRCVKEHLRHDLSWRSVRKDNSHGIVENDVSLSVHHRYSVSSAYIPRKKKIKIKTESPIFMSPRLYNPPPSLPPCQSIKFHTCVPPSLWVSQANANPLSKSRSHASFPSRPFTKSANLCHREVPPQKLVYYILKSKFVSVAEANTVSIYLTPQSWALVRKSGAETDQEDGYKIAEVSGSNGSTARLGYC